MRLRIVNWREYQHYGERNPPWIKLHNRLLSGKTWVMLDDASRVLAVASMLLASRDDEGNGSFDGDPEFVQRVAYLHQLPNWEPLIQERFVEVVVTQQELPGLPPPTPPPNAERETEKNTENTITEAASEALASASKRQRKAFCKPTAEEVSAYCTERNNGIDTESFISHYESNGWMVGKTPMKNWMAAVRTWEKNHRNGTIRNGTAGTQKVDFHAAT